MKKIFAIFCSTMLVFAFTSCKDQKQQEDALSLSPSDPIEFETLGGVKTITVTTNLATWDVTSSQEWCKVAKVSNGTTFTVTADKYFEESARPAATVTVTAKNGGVVKTATLTVNQKGTKTEPFTLTLSNIVVNGVEMAVVPTDKKSRYYYDVISKAVLTASHGDSFDTYIDNMIKAAVEQNEGSLPKALEAISTIGDARYGFSTLVPNTDYIAFAIGIGDDGKPASRVVQKEFKTLDNSVDMTFAINVTAKYYDGFDFTITPSNGEYPYYTTFRSAGKYKGLTDDQIITKILEEDTGLIQMRARPGVYVYDNENVWNTATDHYVFVFGFADGVPTTPLAKFEIKTESIPVPAGSSFKFDVTGILVRSANVEVTPDVDKAMYMWDIMDETMYQKYKADIPAFVQLYVHEVYTNLDRMLSRGPAGNLYSRKLTPNTKYYVWAAYMDQFGAVMGDIKLVEAFTTLPSETNDMKISSEVKKYFNGDDLFNKDPILYAQAKGMAYVPITFSVPKEAPLWYAVMVSEEASDPTDNISDADMAFALETGAGIWCNVGGIYFCEWDKDHTALGVIVARNDSYGKVLRDKYKFTKAGASPISEFVEPNQAPAAVKNMADGNQANVKVFKEVQKK